MAVEKALQLFVLVGLCMAGAAWLQQALGWSALLVPLAAVVGLVLWIVMVYKQSLYDAMVENRPFASRQKHPGPAPKDLSPGDGSPEDSQPPFSSNDPKETP